MKWSFSSKVKSGLKLVGGLQEGREREGRREGEGEKERGGGEERCVFNTPC